MTEPTSPESPLRGRRALVLGASGFVGRWVARELARRGARVVAHARDRARLPRDVAATSEPVEADLSAPGTAIELVRAARPDVTFNLVGYGVAKDERDARGYARLNDGLVAELLEACADEADASGPRLLHVGSALEFGDAPDLDERTPGAPTEPYGKSKEAATRAVFEARDRVLGLVLRTYTVFGLGERPGRLVPTLLAARGKKGPIPLSAGVQTRDFVYVEDVARGLADLAEVADVDAATVRAAGYPFDAPCLNLASGSLTRVRDFVLAFADTFEIDRDRLAFDALPPLAEEQHHPPVPIARLRAALGWSPSGDPRDGLARMAKRLEEGLT